MEVKIKLLYDTSKMPKKMKDGDAAFDCYVHHKEHDANTDTTYLCLGFAIEIPEGYFGLLCPRSSMNKTRLYAPASIGIIDPNYRGEVKFVYKHPVNSPFYSTKGERYCQLLIIKNTDITLVPSDELSETNRGDKGFGSSGKF